MKRRLAIHCRRSALDTYSVIGDLLSCRTSVCLSTGRGLRRRILKGEKPANIRVSRAV